MNRFQVRKVAVLGAGVMGAQIAAHLVNVNVPVILFDLPAREGAKNGIVTKAIDGLKKLKPAPLGNAADASLIGQANYEEHLDQLKDCDLVIEAIAERMDWKRDLYQKIAGHIAPHAIVASNTSGLSITALSEALPESVKPRFWSASQHRYVPRSTLPVYQRQHAPERLAGEAPANPGRTLHEDDSIRLRTLELKRGMVTMCVGTGLGAAGIFEAV